MKVIKSSCIIYVDVDDTLVIWDWKKFDPEGKGLLKIFDSSGNFSELLLPHYRHIDMIKNFKTRGHTIVVWSQGGWEWAENVVKALGIEEMVDVVMTKPDWYIDDLPASAYMTSPIYLHPTDPNQDKRSWVVDDGDK